MRENFLLRPIRLLFILLILGLIYTQIVRHSYYHKLSKDNAIRIIPIDGLRGSMFDRNGVKLVCDKISFNVAVVYQEIRNRGKLISLLNGVLDMPRKDIESALEKAGATPYAPVTIIEDIDKEKAFILEEESFDVRGLVIETKPIRRYLYGNIGAHVFGYLSEITEDELQNLKGYGYRMKDLVGRDGLEKYYDRYLAGVDGGTQILVDNKGRHVRTLGLKEPARGRDLHLTIDINLQTVCDKTLEGKRGAAIVMDPNTGEVLALSSSPGFDPNIFVDPEGSQKRVRLIRDKRFKPLFNRAISGLYQPGSVFKIVIASAALETGRITRNTRFNCNGIYTLGRGRFVCWKEGGHGPQNIVDALMNSCNIFFYNTGRAVGVDNIESFAKLFGFGKKTGIDLPDEAKGIAPGRMWKKAFEKDNWYEGDTINYAIGQGYLLVTPIQILEMMSIMANKGSLVKPYLVKQINDTKVASVSRRDLGLKADTIKTVREGLYKVVNAPEGTGKHAGLEGLAIAGKTGTAQNPSGRTHAWFSGFAPFDGAKVCVVVFLEHGGKGGLEPAEIAREIFKEANKRNYL